MTISNTSRTAGPFIGNGVTKNFPFSYKVFHRSDVLVALTVIATEVETLLALDVDYTVTLNTDQNSNPGGVINLVVAPPVGTTLAATSNIALVQSLDLTNNGGFYPTVINDALDRIVMNLQQLAGKIGNGLGIGMAAISDAALLALSTVQQIGTSAGSSLIGFVQAGTGAVQRTVADKLLDNRRAVKDFGAAGNGLTNDTAAFNRARTATGGRYHISNGTYVLDAAPNIDADAFTSGDNVTLIIDGTPYDYSNAFFGALRLRTDSAVLSSIVHARTGNVLLQFQNGAPGTATYYYRGLSIQTDSHCVQVGPKTVGGSVDFLWQRSASHPTDPGGNRFNETFEEGQDRKLYSVATSLTGFPSFDSYMRVWAGPNAKMDFPFLAPCFRQGFTLQNRAETGYKLAFTIGSDRHHITDAAATFTHMTFKSDGSVGFFGAGGITRPTIEGARGGNVALANLLTALAQLGLIQNDTTA